MAVGKYLAEAASYLKLGGTALKTGGGRIISFFSSGWYSYLGMFLFVVAPHYQTLLQGNYYQTFINVGKNLGQADTTIAQNIGKLGAAGGAEYLSILITVLSSLFAVLWFLRTVAKLLEFIWGEMVPDIILYGFASMMWIISVLYVTGDLPVATLDLILRIPEVIDPGKILGLENQTAENVTETLNSTRQ